MSAGIRPCPLDLLGCGYQFGYHRPRPALMVMFVQRASGCRLRAASVSRSDTVRMKGDYNRARGTGDSKRHAARRCRAGLSRRRVSGRGTADYLSSVTRMSVSSAAYILPRALYQSLRPELPSHVDVPTKTVRPALPANVSDTRTPCRRLARPHDDPGWSTARSPALGS